MYILSPVIDPKTYCQIQHTSLQSLQTYMSIVDFQFALKSLANAAEDSFNKLNAFPMTHRAYRLALTAPISVVKMKNI